VIPLPTTACLQAFESVARHGSITRAAEELNLTQSAVSRQIHQIEELLDVPLFDRVRQRVFLTDAGKLYLNEVTRVIASLKDATSKIMACGGNEHPLNLAVLPTFATRWLMPRLFDFLNKHPGITINFSTRLLPFDFGEQPFDAAVHYGIPNWPGAKLHHLMDEDIVPACSPKFEAEQRIRKPSDLARTTLLHQTTRVEAWKQWFQLAGIKNEHSLRGPRFEQFTMLAQAAICDLGVALLPRFLIDDELASGKLVLLFNCPVRSTSSYYLAVPETKPASIPTSAFTQWLIGQAKATMA
jgi:LysR family transcriptional regulator, glycine cleavage system transcriptional activator